MKQTVIEQVNTISSCKEGLLHIMSESKKASNLTITASDYIQKVVVYNNDNKKIYVIDRSFWCTNYNNYPNLYYMCTTSKKLPSKIILGLVIDVIYMLEG